MINHGNQSLLASPILQLSKQTIFSQHNLLTARTTTRSRCCCVCPRSSKYNICPQRCSCCVSSLPKIFPPPTTSTVRGRGSGATRGAEHQQEPERTGRCNRCESFPPCARPLPELNAHLSSSGKPLLRRKRSKGERDAFGVLEERSLTCVKMLFGPN